MRGASVTTAEQARIMIEMAAAVVGGKEKLRQRPLFSSVLCPSNPLNLGKDCCDVIIESAITGVPCIV